MSWPWEIVERDHDIQNPTSPAKIRLLGDYLRLTPASRVLDVACGKAGPALVLASAYGCPILGIELRPGFAEEARARVRSHGLESLIEVRTANAGEVELEPEAWDAALCLGASFIWGTIADAATALLPAVRRGGRVAIGEPYWRSSPLPEGSDAEEFVNLELTAARFEEPGLELIGLITASEDDWDHYESLHWRAIEEWLAESPDQPETDDVRERHVGLRRDYLRFKRELLGWAIFVGRKG